MRIIGGESVSGSRLTDARQCVPAKGTIGREWDRALEGHSAAVYYLGILYLRTVVWTVGFVGLAMMALALV